jgi:hypothetical protein
MSKIIKIKEKCPPWCILKGHLDHSENTINNPAGGTLCCNKINWLLYIDDGYNWFDRAFATRGCIFK